MEENNNSKWTFKRIMALITVIVIALLIIGMLICAIIGSPFFLPLLYLTFIVPILLYIINWLYKVLSK